MLTLLVPEMSCSHCQSTIDKAIHKLDAAAKITVDLASHHLEIISEKSSTAAIIAALKTAGYDSQPVSV